MRFRRSFERFLLSWRFIFGKSHGDTVAMRLLVARRLLVYSCRSCYNTCMFHDYRTNYLIFYYFYLFFIIILFISFMFIGLIVLDDISIISDDISINILFSYQETR